MSSAAEGREAISEPFTGTAPQRGKRNEDSFITKQHVVTCDQGCSASLSRAAVVAVFLFFHVAGRVHGTAGCSTFAHLRGQVCSWGQQGHSATGKTSESVLQLSFVAKDAA